jgi:hypothetical protein
VVTEQFGDVGNIPVQGDVAASPPKPIVVGVIGVGEVVVSRPHAMQVATAALRTIFRSDRIDTLTLLGYRQNNIATTKKTGSLTQLVR